MEVITIESKAFQVIIEKLNFIADHIMQTKKKNIIDEEWIDNFEVCELLKISNRTLQRLRAAHKIEYSKSNGKVYFKIEEIRRMLEENTIKRDLNEFEQSLLKKRRYGK